MTHSLAKPRFDRARLAAAIVAGSVVFVSPPPAAQAGTLAVNACGANGLQRSWRLDGASSFCPHYGNLTRGISTRMDGAGAGFPYRRAWLDAPGGTRISALTWAGRAARESCGWAVQLRAKGPGFDTLIAGFNPETPGSTFCFVEKIVGNNFVPGSVGVPFGTTQLLMNTQCGWSSCAGVGTVNTFESTVYLDDFSPPSLALGGLAPEQWIRGDAAINFSAIDNLGIRSAQLYVDGAPRADQRSFPCDNSQLRPCSNQSGSFAFSTTGLAAGRHAVAVRSLDGSNTPVTQMRYIRVDNTPPAQFTPVVAGGQGWRRRNGFAVQWQPLPDAGAPIVGATWELCRPGRTRCTSGQVGGTNVGTMPEVRVPSDGVYELRVVSRDQAGNVALLRDARPAFLRLDGQDPSVSIDRQDPGDALAVTASVRDQHSGLAGGEIEMRRRGGNTWHELATRVAGSKLVAELDDERFSDGTWELRARVVDRAGNEASTYTQANGARATRTLPLRIKTVLRVGKRVVKSRSRVVGRGKRRRVVRRRSVSFRRSVRIRYGRRGVVRGVLTNPDGQPIDGATIRVAARPDLPGEGFAAAGLARTDARGRFSYIARGSRSRTLRFRYAGTRRIRAATEDVRIKVPASSTFRLTPTRLLNGQSVRLSGRLRGGPIPSTGKLISLQKRAGRKWEQFRVVRTDQSGRWRHDEPVLSVRGLVIFTLRAFVPREAGFPYHGGATRARKLRVRGQ